MQTGRFRLVIVVLLLLLSLLIGLATTIVAQDAEITPEATEEATHWEYEGEHGAEHWGEMGDEFALCGTGSAQSPIDISGETEVNLSDIEFSYSQTALNIFNNGHTIQVNVDAGSSILYNGIRYDLLQFHFHHPSEHTVDGVAAPMELHLVHRDPNSGNLAVVGVMLVEGESSNEDVASIFSNLPAEPSEASPMGSINLTNLLPESKFFTTYNGSLTTPPCNEIVRWLVLDASVMLSVEQIEAFGALFEMNARPVQPLNGRDLLGDNG
jgi:carbonic anhydrase